MAKRYSIWDKQTNVITPVGEVLTPEEWIARYPVAGLESVTIVGSAGEINGGLFATLSQMKLRCEQAGATFDEGLSDQQLLDAIEAFEDEQAAKAAAAAAEPTSDERIAAALEYQNLLSL